MIDGDLHARLSQLAADAVRARPELAVAAERFTAYLAERCAADTDLATLQIADLLLACACVDGHAGAIAELDRTYLAALPRMMNRARPSPAELDELRQLLATKLLVGEDAQPPRLAQYGGKGPLGVWIKVVASRALSNQRRGAEDRAAAEERAANEPVGGGSAAVAERDPELALIRRRFGVDFHAAISAAFASLELRDRNLLRLHFVDRLSIDALAPIFAVSRATAARHLAAARMLLTERTIDQLGARLAVGASELASLVREVRSKLDISLSSILRG